MRLPGCPAAVGNLWDVTDRDIDRYTRAVLDEWTTAPGREADPHPPAVDPPGGLACMGHAVKTHRTKCRLPHLIGAAPVCYGLPTLLKACAAQTL